MATPQTEKPNHGDADLLLLRGRIYTLCAGVPWVEALAISGGRVVACGRNCEIERLRSERTEVIDLTGRFAMPGFNDAHIHLTPEMLPSLAAYGITTAQSINDPRDALQFLENAEDQPSSLCRLEFRLPIQHWRDFNSYRRLAEASHGMLRFTGLKAYIDGMVRRRSAFMLHPYAGSLDSYGALSPMAADPRGFAALLAEGASTGGDLSVHAIGDAGVGALLDHYERLIDASGENEHRFRVCHATVIAPEDLPRFGRLRLIAEMNPYHARAIPWLKATIGEGSTRWAFAFRSLKSHGAIVCFGSDHPGPDGSPEFPLNPLLGIQSALLHENGFERLSLHEAITAYTSAPAYASRQELSRGSLEPNKDADVIVLDQNPFTVSPLTLDKVRVVRTIVNGRTVFKAE